MPTNRTRTSRSRADRGGVPEGVFTYFSMGPFFDAEHFEDDKSPEQIRDLWRQYRDRIMARVMAENKSRGWKVSRPWSFWKFEAPEPRLAVPPGQSGSQKIWDHQKDCFDWVESDLEYLARLGLLEPWEQE